MIESRADPRDLRADELDPIVMEFLAKVETAALALEEAGHHDPEVV